MKNHWLNKKLRIVDIRVSSSEGVNPTWCPENVEIEFSSGNIYHFYLGSDGIISTTVLKYSITKAGKNEWNIAFDRAKIVFSDRLKAIELIERTLMESPVCTRCFD